MADGLIAPHGGTLVNRIATGAEAASLADKAKSLPKLALTMRPLSDLEMIAVGAFSPLTGFMTQADYKSVVKDMHLANGLPWSLPVTASATKDAGAGLEGKQIALTDEEGNALAVMDVEETYDYDKARRGAHRLPHRGRQAPRRRGGVRPGRHAARRPGHGCSTASSTRSSCSTAATPRRRAPPSRRAAGRRSSASRLATPCTAPTSTSRRCAMETVDGLLLHPLVGATKDDDIPAPRAHGLLRGAAGELLPGRTACCSPSSPRPCATPARARRSSTPWCARTTAARTSSSGATTPASATTTAPTTRRHIFDEFEPGELGITPMFFENSFFCRTCGTMGTAKTCPHGDDDHVSLSGTRVREMLTQGEMPPSEFSRPEVAPDPHRRSARPIGIRPR